MSKKFGYAAAALGAAALLGASALPASAASTGDTYVTFTLSAAGGLDITVPNQAQLANGQAGDAVVAGALGNVTVTDNRGSSTGWNMNAYSTNFTEQNRGVSSYATVDYNSRQATSTTGTVSPYSVGNVRLVTGGTSNGNNNVAIGSSASGNNSATFAPMLTVTLPPSVLAGNYVGVVTTSVS